MEILLMTSIRDWISGFDSGVYSLVSSFISDGLTDFMVVISFIGSGWILTPISVLALIASLWVDKTARWGWLICINLAAVSLINNTMKVILHRQRPEIMRLVEVSGYSFPSWHAMTAAAFFGFLMHLSMKHLKHWSRYILAGVFSILILLIGISRIYLGVHYASDVLGGFILGFVWLGFYILFSRKLVK